MRVKQRAASFQLLVSIYAEHCFDLVVCFVLCVGETCRVGHDDHLRRDGRAEATEQLSRAAHIGRVRSEGAFMQLVQ